ncbi:hypothetical protein [Streptomyces yaizuensis]|uniref:Uncharacterized protein n=1 Tax=Streptomyces yaizuensis TaxID=2989713 RepID=A0AA86J344_9ACTN|nr:hypothetical protein [Streptomyces sp. YSPA8]BDT39557.1 hypothetical protein SYYSPA8_37195 [Streptomyces sp. YSPA8]
MSSNVRARHSVVPWITPGSQENLLPLPLRVHRGRLAYVDETPADRSPSGVLLHRGLRNLPERERGGPRFLLIHPARQRAAMTGNLCQVCGGPASVVPERGGTLFLLPGSTSSTGSVPEDEVTVRPPLCTERRCAQAAIELCPELQRGFTAVRVRYPIIFGFTGRIYEPAGDGPPVDTGKDLTVPLTHARMPWLLAVQIAVVLQGCTRVDLRDERERGAA